MKENNLPQTTNQNELMTVTIPEETIDLFARLSDENAMWIKINDAGFLINDKIIAEIIGIIVNVYLYYVMWVDKKPSKIPFEGQAAPEGYELRCDLKINVQETILGLSLPKTSTKTHLARYIKFLRQSGLRPNDVFTRVRVKGVSSPHGKFNVCVFDSVGGVHDMKAVPASPDPYIIDVPVTEASQPRPVQTSANPWA